MTVKEQAVQAREASLRVAGLPFELKDKALKAIAEKLRTSQEIIISENKKDLAEAEKNQLEYSLHKRLVLNEKKLAGILSGIEGLRKLPEPVGNVQLKRELDSGLLLKRITVPIGVIGVIFESRPDALVQIATLCLKSGNASVLKGGKEALHTNRILHQLINEALMETDVVFAYACQLLESREEISQLLECDDQIDLMIPRGSNALVRHIQANTKIPVLGHADGICHVYIDETADLGKALKISKDSKCQYPAVCNAVETLLVHEKIAASFLPALQKELDSVKLLGCAKTCEILKDIDKAEEEDWSTEYNDLILSIKMVSSLAEALTHINHYGSGHTDCIVCEHENRAEEFLSRVDSSSVLHNCSTRFADGFRYGFGAEVGISTNKVHARGPVGLEGLCIYKYQLCGEGHIVADYAEGRKAFTHRDLEVED